MKVRPDVPLNIHINAGSISGNIHKNHEIRERCASCYWQIGNFDASEKRLIKKGFKKLT